MVYTFSDINNLEQATGDDIKIVKELRTNNLAQFKEDLHNALTIQCKTYYSIQYLKKCGFSTVQSLECSDNNESKELFKFYKQKFGAHYQSMVINTQQKICFCLKQGKLFKLNERNEVTEEIFGPNNFTQNECGQGLEKKINRWTEKGQNKIHEWSQGLQNLIKQKCKELKDGIRKRTEGFKDDITEYSEGLKNDITECAEEFKDEIRKCAEEFKDEITESAKKGPYKAKCFIPQSTNTFRTYMNDDLLIDRKLLKKIMIPLACIALTVIVLCVLKFALGVLTPALAIGIILGGIATTGVFQFSY